MHGKNAHAIRILFSGYSELNAWLSFSFSIFSCSTVRGKCAFSVLMLSTKHRHLLSSWAVMRRCDFVILSWVVLDNDNAIFFIHFELRLFLLFFIERNMNAWIGCLEIWPCRVASLSNQMVLLSIVHAFLNTKYLSAIHSNAHIAK